MLSSLEDAALSHDAHEKTRTYTKIETFDRIFMLLNLNALSRGSESGREKKGELKMKGYPTMLLKNKCRKNVGPHLSNDIYENK